MIRTRCWLIQLPVGASMSKVLINDILDHDHTVPLVPSTTPPILGHPQFLPSLCSLPDRRAPSRGQSKGTLEARLVSPAQGDICRESRNQRKRKPLMRIETRLSEEVRPKCLGPTLTKLLRTPERDHQVTSHLLVPPASGWQRLAGLPWQFGIVAELRVSVLSGRGGGSSERRGGAERQRREGGSKEASGY